MRKPLAILGLFALLLVASLAPADEPEKKGLARLDGARLAAFLFKKMDADGNGKVTKEEFRKFFENRPDGKLKDKPEVIDKLFEKLDVKGNGYLTIDEFRKFAELLKARLADGKLGGPGKKDPADDKKDTKDEKKDSKDDKKDSKDDK
jgi:hypothetical protein